MNKILEAISKKEKVRFKDIQSDTGLSATAITAYLKELVKYTLIVKNEDGTYSKSLASLFYAMSEEELVSFLKDPKNDKFDKLLLSGYKTLNTSSQLFFNKLFKSKSIGDSSPEELAHLNLLFSYIFYTMSYSFYRIVDVKDSEERFNDTKEYLNHILLPIMIIHSNLFRINLDLSRKLLDLAINESAVNFQDAEKRVMPRKQSEKWSYTSSTYSIFNEFIYCLV